MHRRPRFQQKTSSRRLKQRQDGAAKKSTGTSAKFWICATSPWKYGESRSNINLAQTRTVVKNLPSKKHRYLQFCQVNKAMECLLRQGADVVLAEIPVSINET